jgi:hypothetical protein
MLTRTMLLVGTFFLGSGPAAGQPELLPVPREVASQDVLPAPQVMPQPVLLPLRDPPPRLGTRDVWQFYAPSFSGRFVPRVIYSPAGAYYSATGAPYPWTTTRPTLYKAYLVD